MLFFVSGFVARGCPCAEFEAALVALTLAPNLLDKTPAVRVCISPSTQRIRPATTAGPGPNDDSEGKPAPKPSTDARGLRGCTSPPIDCVLPRRWRFLKRISGGRGRLRLPRALPPSPPSGRLQHAASPGTASEGSSRRGDFTLFFRADARPAGAGGSRTGDPSKKTGGGTLATPARTRPKREGARGGRGAEKVGRAVGRGHAAARARQGAHGRAGHGEGARDRCRLRPDAIAPRPAGFGG